MDDVNDWNDAFRDRRRQSEEAVAASAARSHNEAYRAVIQRFEHERPRHQSHSVWRLPIEDEETFRLERCEREAVHRTGKRRKHHADFETLKCRNDAGGTRLTAVVERIVGIPTRSFRAH